MIGVDNFDKGFVSRERVSDYGEVYTQGQQVNDMLDLVHHETQRIESRFLEPACGNGNFLSEILARKLAVVKASLTNPSKDQLNYERHAVEAVTSIYGIDILLENVDACRERLYGIFYQEYCALFPSSMKNDCLESVRYVLSLNIIHGNAMTMEVAGDDSQEPIVFAEWTFNRLNVKRRDYSFRELIYTDRLGSPVISDRNKWSYIPEHIREYPVIPFLRISDGYQEG